MLAWKNETIVSWLKMIRYLIFFIRVNIVFETFVAVAGSFDVIEQMHLN
jgi:hypothetical protein